MSRLPLVAFGALVVATVGAFFVTQHIKVKTPLFTGVHRYPATISPRHGGVCGTVDHRVATITFYLQHRSDDVSVYVIDQGGNFVRTLATGVHMRGGARIRCASTSSGTAASDNGKVVPDGTYHYRIALIGQGRTIDETALPITVKDAVPHPVVTNVSPAVVAPGAPVTISYTDYHRSGTVQIYQNRSAGLVAASAGQGDRHQVEAHVDRLGREDPRAPRACRDVSGRVCDDRCGVQHRPVPIEAPAAGRVDAAMRASRSATWRRSRRSRRIPRARARSCSSTRAGSAYTWTLSRVGVRAPRRARQQRLRPCCT